MNKTQIYTAIREAMEAAKRGEDVTFLLNQLTEALVPDIRTEANKAAGAGKVEKIVKDILKVAGSNASENMHYTAIIDNKQYCLDGFRLLELNTPIDAPIFGEDPITRGGTWYDAKKIMPANLDLVKVDNIPALEDLRMFNKVNKKYNPVAVMSVNGFNIIVNAAWLQNALDNFTDPVVQCIERPFDNRYNISPVIITGKEGRLMLLPINNSKIYEVEPGLYCLDKHGAGLVRREAA